MDASDAPTGRAIARSGCLLTLENTMRGSLIALAATATFVAGPALAQSSANIIINGSIAAKCSALALANSSVTIAPANFEDPSAVGALAPVFTSAGGIAITNTTSSVTCNGAGTTVTLDAKEMTGPVLPSGAAAGGFSNRIDFTASVDAPGYAQSKAGAGVIATNASTTTPTTATVGLLASTLNIKVGSAVAGGILVAGGYSGEVALTLTPGV